MISEERITNLEYMRGLVVDMVDCVYYGKLCILF